MRISVVIPAAGKGRRAGFSENKIFHLLPDGRTVLERAASAFFPFAEEIIIAADPAEEGRVRALFGSRVRVVTGGKTRTDSVRRALEAATGEIVLVHDAARPYVSEAVIRDCIASVKKYGSGIPALPTADTVCRAFTRKTCAAHIAWQRGNMQTIPPYTRRSAVRPVSAPEGRKTENSPLPPIFRPAMPWARDLTATRSPRAESWFWAAWRSRTTGAFWATATRTC